ncbi:Txe/YoeB family addiction module toxin (plasmid) [Enterobacter asburiae]
MKTRFTRRAAADYQYWQENNAKVFERVRHLIQAIHADPFNGIGKPERLRHYKNPALYSRRIDREHRLVYSMANGELTIVACRYHYDDI